MRKLLVILGVFGSLVIGAAEWWRRHPRSGAGLANEVVNPWLVGKGIVDRSADEIGMVRTIERVLGTPIPRVSEPGFDFGT